MESQNKTPVAQGVEQAIKQEAPQVDAAVMIRQAMANNFIQHCVNAAAADGAENPLMAGATSAVNELLVAVLNQGGDEQIQQNINLVANALVTIGFGEKTNLAEQLMTVWAVASGRNGGLNALLGKMRDASEVDYRSFMQEQLELTNKAATDAVVTAGNVFNELHPEPTAPTEIPADEKPVVESQDVFHQQELDAAKAKAESLPVEAVPVDVEAVPVEG